MLDKLKDKTSAVIVALQSALDESIKYCFELGEAVDEACVALSHKVPKVQVETLKWLAKTFEGMNRASISALHKSIVPPIVKCTSASNPDARNGALEDARRVCESQRRYEGYRFLTHGSRSRQKVEDSRVTIRDSADDSSGDDDDDNEGGGDDKSTVAQTERRQ